MKKLLIMMLAAAAVVSSCTKDVDVDSKSASTFSVSVGLPSDAVSTRAAFADPTLEADMRLYVFVTYKGEIVDKVEYTDWDGQTSVSNTFTLASNVEDYAVSAWADYGDTYYTVTNGINEAPSVEFVSTTISASDAKRDAYYAVSKVEAGVDLALDLARPFALVNITTTDCDEPTVYNANLLPEEYEITGLKSYTALDLTDGSTIGDMVELTIGGTCAEPSTQASSVNLSYDYVLLNENEDQVLDFVASYTNVSGADVTSYSFTNIPVKRNYKTNISGNIITKAGDLSVSIDQVWEDEITEVVSMFTVAAGSNDIVLTMDDIESLYASGGAALIFYGGGAGTTINISFDSQETAEAAATLILDFSNCDPGTDVTFSGEYFTGMVYFGDYSDPNYAADPTVYLGDLVVYIPNGSGTLCSGMSVNSLTVTTAPATFIMEEGSQVVEDLTVLGGRTIVDGTVGEEIFVYNDSVVEIEDNMYAASSIKNLYYTAVYGVDVDLQSVIDVFTTEVVLPDFMNYGAGVSYAAAVGNFNFNNNSTGFNINTLRNITYTLKFGDSAITSATLKEELDFSVTTADDVADALNVAIAELATALEGETAKLEGAFAKLEPYLTTEMMTQLQAEVDKVEAAVEAYTSSIPEIVIPDGAGVPIGTVLPDPDNFEIEDLLAFIGTPEDEFSLLDAADYASGDKTITLYMLVNLATTVSELDETVAEIQAEITALENENLTLEAENAGYTASMEGNAELNEIETRFDAAVADYDDLDAPSLFGYNGGVWTIAPASTYDTVAAASFGLIDSYDLSTNYSSTYVYNYYSYTGTPSSSNLTKMNAKNAQLDEIVAIIAEYKAKIEELGYGELSALIDANDDIISANKLEIYELTYTDLLVANAAVAVYDTAFETMGLSTGVLDIIVASADYLEYATEVLNSMNEYATAIRDFNPWVYTPVEGASFANGVSSADAVLDFEFTEGQRLYVYSSSSQLVE